MFLSDIDIKKALEAKEIVISDFDEKRLQPASYDILLGNKFLVFGRHHTPYIDPVKKILPEYREIILNDDETFVLHPGVSILGVSIDYFGSDKYLVQLSGKSSLARIGLLVHNTAGIINPGHFLNITFELCNLNSVPIILRPKMEIAQILFSKISSPCSKDYKKVGRFKDGEDNFVSYQEKK
ncbi:MAG: dCTP deaminase [Candidatus Gracilibacteria bacterium]|nr:dCTP deaminase [Candidatus Gracilibacteria bacterium]